MAIEEIDLGTAPTGAGGDTVRGAFEKTNANFAAQGEAIAESAQQAQTAVDESESRMIQLIESLHGDLGVFRAGFRAQSFLIADEGKKKLADFSDLFSMSRPGPTWVWGADGRIVEVPTDQPAYPHDPETGKPLGLGVYSAGPRTNRLPYSYDLTQWGRQVNCNVELVEDERFGLVSRVTTHREDGNGGESSLGGAMVQVTEEGDDSVRWLVVKPIDLRGQFTMSYRNDRPGNACNLHPDGSVTTSGSNLGVIRKEIGDGWILMGFTYANARGEGTYRSLGLGWRSDQNEEPSEVLIAHVQFELGLTPTQPIPTNGDIITVPADIAYSEQVDGRYNPERGSLYFSCTDAEDVKSGAKIVLQRATASGYDDSILVSTARLEITTGSTSVARITLGGPAYNVGVSWDNGTIVIVINGEERFRGDAAMPGGVDRVDFQRRKSGAGTSDGTVQDFWLSDEPTSTERFQEIMA